MAEELEYCNVGWICLGILSDRSLVVGTGPSLELVQTPCTDSVATGETNGAHV